MKKLLAAIVLALFANVAQAQVTITPPLASGTVVSDSWTRTGTAITVTNAGDTINTGTGVVTVGGPLKLGNGAVDAPSWSFASEATTGFYRYDANVLALSIAGALQVAWYPGNMYFKTDTFKLNFGVADDVYIQRSGAAALITNGSWTTSGTHTATGGLVLGAATYWVFGSRAGMTSPADGELNALNYAGTLTAGIRQLWIVEAVTTTKAPNATENNELYTNTGDADGTTFTLPNDPSVGSVYHFGATVAQLMTIAPSAGETLYLNGAACAVSITGNTIGSFLTITAAKGGSGGIWIAIGTGTWNCNS